MKRLSNRTGSAHIVAVLSVIVLALAVIAGYRVYQLQYGNNKQASTGTKQTAQADQTTVPSTLQSASDLKKTEDAIDADKSDENLDPSQLDTDLNNLP